MPAQVNAGRPRLRELRIAADWTQQQLADKLAYLAWMQGKGRPAVTADMVAKWERGAKGISARYRTLLCHLFGVTRQQLGFAVADIPAAPEQTARDPESLVAMVDQTAGLLEQLGDAGNGLAPQLLSRDGSATNYRDMLGAVDLSAQDPASHAHAVTITIEDLEHLADRYADLYQTADPAALLHPVSAHVKTASRLAANDHTQTGRRRVLRNLARVATLAGRLCGNDIGDGMSARGYYALAVDAAQEAGDDTIAAHALGYAAEFAHAQGMTNAAMSHLTAAATYAKPGTDLAGWLAEIEATIQADQGDQLAAEAAINRAESAEPCRHQASARPTLLATAGHVQLRAGNHAEARRILLTALERTPPGDHRTRVRVLTELATVELQTGDNAAACRYAAAAADTLRGKRYAAGIAQLRQFRDLATSPVARKALRFLDEYLAQAAA